jgi:hypothetical protein
MAWNVSGLSMETTIGGKNVFEQADVLLFMETWEALGNGLPTIGGFECIGSIFNAKVGGKSSQVKSSVF